MTELTIKVDNPDDSVWSLFMLDSYLHKSHAARYFNLEENSKRLEEILKPDGQYAGQPEAMRHFLESRIYLETFEKVCQVAEDFALVARALSKPRNEFARNIRGKANPLKDLPRETKDWYTLLNYQPMEAVLPVELLSRIELIRLKNAEAINQLRARLQAWLTSECHWQIYQSLKHGNSLLYGVKPTQMWNERTFGFATQTDLGKSGRQLLLILNRSIDLYLRTLIEEIITVCVDLVDRSLWSVKNGFGVLEHSFLYTPTDEERGTLSEIANGLVIQAPDWYRPIDILNFEPTLEVSDETATRIKSAYDSLAVTRIVRVVVTPTVQAID